MNINHQNGFYCGIACGTVCSSLTIFYLYYLNKKSNTPPSSSTVYGDNYEEFEYAGNKHPLYQ